MWRGGVQLCIQRDGRLGLTQRRPGELKLVVWWSFLWTWNVFNLDELLGNKTSCSHVARHILFSYSATSVYAESQTGVSSWVKRLPIRPILCDSSFS